MMRRIRSEVLRQILCAPSVVFTKCASLLKSILNYSAQKLLLPVCFPIDDKKIERFGVVRGLRLLAASFLSSGMSLQANTSPLLLVSLQVLSPSVRRAAFLCVDAHTNKNQDDTDEDEINIVSTRFTANVRMISWPIRLFLNDLVPQICKLVRVVMNLLFKPQRVRKDGMTPLLNQTGITQGHQTSFVLRKTFHSLLCRLLSRGDESANVRLLIDTLWSSS